MFVITYCDLTHIKTGLSRKFSLNIRPFQNTRTLNKTMNTIQNAYEYHITIHQRRMLEKVVLQSPKWIYGNNNTSYLFQIIITAVPPLPAPQITIQNPLQLQHTIVHTLHASALGWVTDNRPNPAKKRDNINNPMDAIKMIVPKDSSVVNQLTWDHHHWSR